MIYGSLPNLGFGKTRNSFCCYPLTFQHTQSITDAEDDSGGIVMKVMVIISFPDWSVTNWPCLLHSSFSSPLSPLRLLILWKVINIDALISTMTINWLLSAPLSSASLSSAPWWLPKYPHRGGGLHEPRGVPGHKQRMFFWRRPRQPQKRNRGETAPTPMLLIWYNKKENLNK